MGDVTQLLQRIREQDGEALNRLFAVVYDDLHRMARARLAHNSPMTLLDPTSLVHEAYLRLHQAGQIDLDSRGRFMAWRRCCVPSSSTSPVAGPPSGAAGMPPTSR